MTDAGRIPAPKGASIPAGVEVWTVGQHPAVSDGWIVRPVLFGSRVRVLPEWEGGHVVIKSEADARLIGAAPSMLSALVGLVERYPTDALTDNQRDDLAVAVGAIAEAQGAEQ